MLVCMQLVFMGLFSVVAASAIKQASKQEPTVAMAIVYLRKQKKEVSWKAKPARKAQL